MIHITFTVRNDNPDTIFNRLAERLGREPTDAEATAEVRRILAGDSLVKPLLENDFSLSEANTIHT